MRHLLRRLLVVDKKSLVGAVAMAVAVGSAVAYSNLDPHYRPSIAVSFPRSAGLSFVVPSGIASFIADPFVSDHGSHFFAADTTSHTNDGAKDEGSGHTCQCLGRDTIANAAAKVGPAIVNIYFPEQYHGRMSIVMGSGTIIDSDGTILTCAHNVSTEGTHPSVKEKVEVSLQDGRTFVGTVLNADFHSDIALVKITSNLPLPTAQLGSSKRLRPGDWVIAMGCPLSLQNTVTAGIVSCVDRKAGDLGIRGMTMEYLQTDCATNGGNSGGPLVNIDGEVIGVIFMKAPAADGVSFALPIDSVSEIIRQFKKRGRVVRPWIGLKMVDLNEMIIAQLKEREPTFPSVEKGVLVPMVAPGSPAERAGFRPGDVVIEFEGKPVSSINEIVEIMDDKVGILLKAVVRRGKDGVVKLTVTPEEANPDM